MHVMSRDKLAFRDYKTNGIQLRKCVSTLDRVWSTDGKKFIAVWAFDRYRTPQTLDPIWTQLTALCSDCSLMIANQIKSNFVQQKDHETTTYIEIKTVEHQRR